ncbi:MAG: NifU family protein, partial [Deltaproteobacteria bacterium]
LMGVDGTRVFVRMGGGCQGCGMADVTLKQGVESALREQIPEITEILDTTDHASGTNPFYQHGP